MNQNPTQPIIVKKKMNGHGGHHGGAWKVAYADFVTAMMALFIVLWLMNSSEQVRKAISAYFRDPSGSGKLAGSASGGTGEGLRVELLESDKGMFFQSGSASPSGLGEEMIIRLAEELAKLPNNLLIEGHTDAKPFSGRQDYSNWELSTDRANAARRLIEAHGIRPGRVVQVRGFADQNLRNPERPEEASNRRVSVIVRYRNAVKLDDTLEPPPGAGYQGAKETAKKAER